MCDDCARRIAMLSAPIERTSATWTCPKCGPQTFEKSPLLSNPTFSTSEVWKGVVVILIVAIFAAIVTVAKIVNS